MIEDTAEQKQQKRSRNAKNDVSLSKNGANDVSLSKNGSVEQESSPSQEIAEMIG